MKSIDEYLQLPYTIEVLPEEDGPWFARIKELPGCMTNAATPEEALVEIQILKREWLENALEDGFAIPEPRPEEDFSGQFRTRVPKSLHRLLVEKAKNQGVSLNLYINFVLAKAVGAESRIEAPTQTSIGLPAFVECIINLWDITYIKADFNEENLAKWLNSKLPPNIYLSRRKDVIRTYYHLASLFREVGTKSDLARYLSELIEHMGELMEESVSEDKVSSSRYMDQIDQSFGKDKLRDTSPLVQQFEDLARSGYQGESYE